MGDIERKARQDARQNKHKEPNGVGRRLAEFGEKKSNQMISENKRYNEEWRKEKGKR